MDRVGRGHLQRSLAAFSEYPDVLREAKRRLEPHDNARIQRNQQVKQRRRMEYAESKKMEASTPLIFVIGYFIVSFIYFNRAEWERKGEELLLYLDWIYC